MSDSKKTNETDAQLELYGLLVDQVQKYNVILWQFPTVLVTANFFALDKFADKPRILFALAVLDIVLVYAFHRLVINQKTIIKASQRAEAVLKDGSYKDFIPDFVEYRPKASDLTAWTLWLMTAVLFIYSYNATFCHCSKSTRSSELEYKSFVVTNASFNQELNQTTAGGWRPEAFAKGEAGTNQSTIILTRPKQK